MPSQSPSLQLLQERFQQLASELSSVGFFSPGSISQRFLRCGKPSCRCHSDLALRHGPYWQWTRSLGGRTLNRHLSSAQVELFRQWIDNHHRLLAILAEMEALSAQAIDAIIDQAPASSQPQPPTA